MSRVAAAMIMPDEAIDIEYALQSRKRSPGEYFPELQQFELSVKQSEPVIFMRCR
jgi:hypothetical protein